MNPALPKQAKGITSKGVMSSIFPDAHYVYLLSSGKCSYLYVGCTSNLEKRITEHKTGRVFSTKKYLPMNLVYYETYISKSDAFSREKSLKQYGSALAKLKLRLKDTLQGGRAG